VAPPKAIRAAMTGSRAAFSGACRSPYGCGVFILLAAGTAGAESMNRERSRTRRRRDGYSPGDGPACCSRRELALARPECREPGTGVAVAESISLWAGRSPYGCGVFILLAAGTAGAESMNRER